MVFEDEVLLLVARVAKEASRRGLTLSKVSIAVESDGFGLGEFGDIKPTEVAALVGRIAHGSTRFLHIGTHIHDTPFTDGVGVSVGIVGDIEIGESQGVAELMAKNTHTHQRTIAVELVTDEVTVEVGAADILVDVVLTRPDVVLAPIVFRGFAASGIEKADEGYAAIDGKAREVNALRLCQFYGIHYKVVVGTKAFVVAFPWTGSHVAAIVVVVLGQRHGAYDFEGGDEEPVALALEVVAHAADTFALLLVAYLVVESRHLFGRRGGLELDVLELHHQYGERIVAYTVDATHTALAVTSQAVTCRGADDARTRSATWQHAL